MQAGKIEFVKLAETINSMNRTSDGGYILLGEFNSMDLGEGTDEKEVVNIEGNSIIKYNSKWKVEWIREIGEIGLLRNITSVKATSDGGVIVGIYLENNKSVTLSGKLFVRNKGKETGVIIKYNEEGKIEWAKEIGGDGSDYIRSVAELNDGSFIVGGYFNSKEIKLDSDSTLTNNNGNNDGMLIKIRAEMGAPELEELIIENKIKEYKITTSVEKIDGVKGGKILGEDLEVYETVKHGETSKSPITMTPDDGYKIVKVTINGVVQDIKEFGRNETYTLEQFSNVKQDIHVVVTYANVDKMLLIKKTDEKGEPLEGVKFRIEQIEPVSESEAYVKEAITDAKGQIVLNLPEGKYNIIETKAPEGYEISDPVVFDTENAEKREITIPNTRKPKLIVHHYVKGTDEPGQELIKVADDEEYYGSTKMQDGKYQEYETKPKMNLDRYELDYELQADGQKEYKMPEKWKGTYAPDNLDADGNIVVTYYYIDRKIPLTVHHYIEGTTTRVLLAEGIEAPDGKAEGNENETYVTHILSEDQLDEKYEIVEGQKDIIAIFTYPEVEVIYYYKPVEREIQINKYAEDEKTPLQGAKFEIVPKGKVSAFSPIVNNGEIYANVDTSKEVIGKLGDKVDDTGEGKYWFVQKTADDETIYYEPTNSKTYMETTEGANSKTAHSYFQIDLTDKEYIGKQFVVVVNARTSSEYSDYGFATITDNVDTPNYKNYVTTGHFMYTSGLQDDTDYTSQILEGGNTYYLHLAYMKDGSSSSYEDRVVINSIKIYEATGTSYYFEDKENRGVYKSNNQQQANKVANSYISIDLRGLDGEYELKVNAEISSQENHDYGYATITKTPERVAHNKNDSTVTRFIYISGMQEAQDYITTLQGGEQYYLHFGYYKDGSTDIGTDTFTINKITLGDVEYKIYTTDEKGKINVKLPVGEYEITEIEAPEGYRIKDEKVSEVTINRDTDAITEIKVVNTKIPAKIVVHHYIYDEKTGDYTEQKVLLSDGKEAEDVIIEGEEGEFCLVQPKQGEELNGKYELAERPENEVVPYSYPQTEVIYYYKIVKREIIINKYKEDGQTPLAGAKFEIREINAEKSPLERIGEFQDNGPIYATADKTKNITQSVLRGIVNDGPSYYTADKNNEIDGVIENIQQNGRPYVAGRTEEIEGLIGELQGKGKDYNTKIEPEISNAVGSLTKAQNSKYYFVENDDGTMSSNNQDQGDTTANSYIPIILDDLDGNYVVVINASITSESSCDEGYATITNSATLIPTVDDTTGQFMRISGEYENEEFISEALQGGRTYYLHLGYEKDGSVSNDPDKLTINSVKVYKADATSYGFEKVEDENNKYISKNEGQSNTEADSYIPINLNSIKNTEIVELVVKAEISSEYSDYGFAVVNKSPNRIEYETDEYYNADMLFEISGQQEEAEYKVELRGGGTYYLHLGYHKDGYTEGNEEITDTLTINDVRIYGTTTCSYGFDGASAPYTSNNKGQDDTEASAYIPINLTNIDNEEAVAVVINASISSDGHTYNDRWTEEVMYTGDYGKIIITDTIDTEQAEYYNEVAKLVGNYKNKEYTIILQGGKTYYLHLNYYKNGYDNGDVEDVTDTFTINSVNAYKTTSVSYGFGESMPYVSNNQNKINTIASAYIPIDLSSYENKMIEIVVEAQISSNYGNEGSIYITDKELEENEYLCQIEGNVEKSEYTQILQGGKEYQLHMIYSKDESTNEDMQVTDTFTINSINVYETREKTYNFEKDGMKYSSNNQGKANTIAASYVPINLTGLEGQYEIKVNAEISSEYSDYGYATIRTDTQMPSSPYDGLETIIYRISEEQEAKDYTTVINGGQEYYLHFVYTKDDSENEGEDSFTINYIRIKQSGSDLYEEILTTDETGKASTELEGGKYSIVEIDTPYGYKTPDEKIQDIEITRDSSTVQIDVTNEKAPAKVIVHHYIYDEEQGGYTEQKVPVKTGGTAQDVEVTKFIGDTYETQALTSDVLKGGYELFEGPENSQITLTKKLTEVYYYYVSNGALIEHNIEKVGTEKITSKEEKITYKITYTAEIEKYTGNSVITITDTLPYKLDKNKMQEIYNIEHQNSQEENWLEEMLDGGQYEETTQTITWAQPITEIDTSKEETEKKTITVEKNINVVFENIDTNKTNLRNTVQGKIELKATEQIEETEPAIYETKTEFTKNIKVTKTWEHGNNKNEKPTQITLQVKNKKTDKVIASYTVGEADNWTHIFIGLPKYDEETGEEIEYTVSEQAVKGEEELLKYYESK